MNGPLTASEVRVILSRADVDVGALDITDEHGDVIVRGPEVARSEAFGVLFAAGLAVAPYSDRDEWMRPDAADWETVLGQRAEMERDYYRSVCGDRHRWMPDERHALEGYRCADCGVTEAELDREQHGWDGEVPY